MILNEIHFRPTHHRHHHRHPTHMIEQAGATALVSPLPVVVLDILPVLVVVEAVAT